MKSLRRLALPSQLVLLMIGLPLLTGADGGCGGGGVVPIGSGPHADAGEGSDSASSGDALPGVDGSPGNDAASPCVTNADCPNGGLCGYLESEACQATGTCFPDPGGARCLIASQLGCGCDGKPVSIDPNCYSHLPSGYNPQPVSHTGACTQDDAGGTDAGAPCNTSADCANNGVCAFLQSEGCAATGTCFPQPTGPRCNIASQLGCGCDGTAVPIDPSCVSGLPDGYQTHRVLHAGSCDGG